MTRNWNDCFRVNPLLSKRMSTRARRTNINTHCKARAPSVISSRCRQALTVRLLLPRPQKSPRRAPRHLLLPHQLRMNQRQMSRRHRNSTRSGLPLIRSVIWRRLSPRSAASCKVRLKRSLSRNMICLHSIWRPLAATWAVRKRSRLRHRQIQRVYRWLTRDCCFMACTPLSVAKKIMAMQRKAVLATSCTHAHRWWRHRLSARS